MAHTLARLAAAGTLTALVLGGAAPALADDSTPAPAPTCDATALKASVDTARTAAAAAKKAFTEHDRGTLRQQADRHRSAEAKEARDAGKEARDAARAATKAKGPQAKAARDAAKVAAAKARLEAREAHAVKKASDRQLKKTLQAEGKQLKAAWDAAKKALHAAEDALEDCVPLVPMPLPVPPGAGAPTTPDTTQPTAP